MSVALQKKKVRKALETKLQGSLKKQALMWFARKIGYRHGSDLYAKNHPERAVDSRQKVLMLKLKKKGLSFREIEETMHLKPASGNDAYRCIAVARRIVRRRKNAA